MDFVSLLYRLYPALPWFPEYKLALELARKYACRSVLDVGCGKGNLFKILNSHGLVDRYVCIDKHDMFSVHHPNARFIKHDARKPLNLGEHFDCAFFVNSIYYVSVSALNNFRNSADVIIVIDIDPSKPHVFLVSRMENVKRLTLTQLERQVVAMGFKILSKHPGTTYALVLAP